MDYKVGDKVFHQSLPKVVWIIEKISDTEVTCSTLDEKSLELKHETFSITSISKKEESKISYGQTRRRNNFY